MAPGMTYKAAGVDIALKQSLIPLFGSIAKTTSGAHVIGGVGGFGALIGLNGARKMRSPVLVAGTDSVGTKLKIAFETGRHDTVGIDCVAMCVNDIICHAARPLFFLDYIGTGKLEEQNRARDRQRRRARMRSGGHEPGRRRDRAAAADSTSPASMTWPASRWESSSAREFPSRRAMRAGDVLIGLASSGLHSNGFSLVRRVC